MNAYESAAMWSLYTKTDESIAIKTTFEKLHLKLSDNFYMGKVKYIDFKNGYFPKGESTLIPFFCKRKSYEHEIEIRAVVLNVQNQFQINSEGNLLNPEMNEVFGIWCQVDLNELIDSIYVAPTSADWFFELVQQIVKRFQLDKPVIRSSLDNEPLF